MPHFVGQKQVRAASVIVCFLCQYCCLHLCDSLVLLVPAEFTNLLQYYTKQGYRVIGAASKSLQVSYSIEVELQY